MAKRKPPVGSLLLSLLLGGWGWLKNAASALLGLIRTYPLQAALIAALCLSGWLWWGKRHAEAQRDTWHRAYDLRVAAEKAAAQAQKALNAKVQQTYEEQADASQERYDASRDRVRDAADRYIADRRLPEQCTPGGGDPASGAGDPAVPAGVPASGYVAVSDADVRACSDATRYAVEAHNYAAGLIAAGAAN